MLAIFDIDGTICDTQDVEGRCYAMAIELVTGVSLATLDWSAYDEPTSSAIVRQLLAGDSAAKEKEDRIKSEFCRLLQEEQPKFPGDFVAIAGAIEFLARLSAEKLCDVAIASGCFDITAKFKLECCGIALDRFPHATSSDTSRRGDIIPLAARRAGFDLSSVVYFGDAPWDVRVSSALGIPMIGIGRRYEQLRTFGLRHIFRDYSAPDKIIDALFALQTQKNKAQWPRP
jgi:phosphoglycolate phosphatase-like HAD superfamily hydrolase